MPSADFISKGVSLAEDGLLIHIPRGSDVLGVAHLDTRFDDKHFFVEEHGQVWSARLDGRLGVYMLLDLLPSMGIETDVLLTSGSIDEESTADGYFGTQEYKWIYSFDLPRSGVAMYQYESQLAAEALKGQGFSLRSHESYTDLFELWFLGVVGFNFGNGMLHNESIFSSALLRITTAQAKKFAKFYNRYRDTVFLYEPTDEDLAVYRARMRGMYDHESDDGPADLYDGLIDPYDFSVPAPQSATWRYCESCGNLFHINALTYVAMIGDGMLMCSSCTSKALDSIYD